MGIGIEGFSAWQGVLIVLVVIGYFVVVAFTKRRF